MKNRFFSSTGIGIVCICSMLIGGCGGGSTGTGGGSRTVEGTTVESASFSPVSGISVHVLETGETVRSNPDGTFSISIPFGITEITLQVLLGETVTDSRVVELNSNDDVALTVQVSSAADTTTKAILEESKLQVAIGGECAQYFENIVADLSPLLAQTKALPASKTGCIVNTMLTVNNAPFVDQIIDIQTKGCSKDDVWFLLNRSTTSTEGTANLSFSFENSIERCKYRVIVRPSDVSRPALETFIYSQTALEKEKILLPIAETTPEESSSENDTSTPLTE